MAFDPACSPHCLGRRGTIYERCVPSWDWFGWFPCRAGQHVVEDTWRNMLENVLVYPVRPVLIVFVDNQPAYPLPIVAVLCVQVHWQSAKCKFVRKNEDKSYVTYLVAAPGFQCIARDKYSKDLSPSETHDQLQVYVHVMDALAGSVDQSLVSVLNPCKESCQNPYRQSHNEPWSIFLVQHVFL